MTKGRDLPEEVIKCWPEVFGEIKLNVLPLRYLHAVMVNFKDGKTWEIKVTARTKKEGWEAFEKSLSELCKSYQNNIVDVNFKLDTKQVKKDIERETQRFLKKKKL
jgi:3-dehydroquinate dehydratase